MNANRAGLAKKPEDYRWSSYPIYFQKEYKEDLIDRDLFLNYGGEDLEKARTLYLKYVEEGLSEEGKPNFPLDKSME